MWCMDYSLNPQTEKVRGHSQSCYCQFGSSLRREVPFQCVKLINENQGAWMAIINWDSPLVFRALPRVAQKTEWIHVLLPWIFNESQLFCLNAQVLSSPTAAMSGLCSPIALLLGRFWVLGWSGWALFNLKLSWFLISYVFFPKYCEPELTCIHCALFPKSFKGGPRASHLRGKIGGL